MPNDFFKYYIDINKIPDDLMIFSYNIFHKKTDFGPTWIQDPITAAV